MADSGTKFAAPIKDNGFDIHVYYTDDTRESAYDLRKRFSEKFPGVKLYRPHDKPIGPHNSGMWEAQCYNQEQFSTYLPWLCLNHGPHSILIHPNTDDPKQDHVHRPLWIGPQLALKEEVFDGFAH